MNWQFWKRKEQDTSQFDRLQEELVNMNIQMKNVADQVTKLKRIQVKSSKSTEEKMDDFTSTLVAFKKQQEVEAENQQYARQQDFVMQTMIRLLDEMDHVSSGIKDSEQGWFDILEQWSRTIQQNLEGMGVYQLDVIGKTFNPEVSESMKTVAKDTLSITPMAPYQVVEVLNRGYITKDGQMIRKAKVVTVKEEDTDGK